MGFRLNLGAGWSAGYAYEHISNADLYAPNPGINLHTFEVRYAF